jgi:folate-binding protein YgfZ
MALIINGAVAGLPNTPDEAVAWHYGNPFQEQRLLFESEGRIDMSHKGVLKVAGQDRLTYINSLTTQLLLDLKPGESSLTLNLNPQGFVVDELHVIDDGEDLWVITEPNTKDDLLQYLQKMKFLMKVEISDVSNDWAVVFENSSALHNQYLTWLNPFPSGGREILIPRSQLMEYVSVCPVGMWAHAALRVENLIPRLGFETDHRTIPNEVGWLETAVHLDKGCYRGQETISKVTRMGKPPRRLALVHFDGSSDELPIHGSEVLFGDSVIGFVGTSIQHYQLGPVALIVIKRNITEGNLSINNQNVMLES